MDKRDYEPGTPAEAAAHLRRVARLPQGRARRLLDRRGGRLDHRRLGDIEHAADALVEAGAVVTLIVQIGFPAAVDREQAIEDAMPEARRHGQPITAEIVETEEHVAAGEFLVKVHVIGLDSAQPR